MFLEVEQYQIMEHTMLNNRDVGAVKLEETCSLQRNQLLILLQLMVKQAQCIFKLSFSKETDNENFYVKFPNV